MWNVEVWKVSMVVVSRLHVSKFSSAATNQSDFVAVASKQYRKSGTPTAGTKNRDVHRTAGYRDWTHRSMFISENLGDWC